ncbi:MAG: TRAP transporter substrate-binding protein DctP [Leucobacter sp.]|nr:TRAP transporter substrate-binding protein DctP [Leucobacter sp.]
MEKNNLHLISYWPSGRLLFGSKEPLEQVEDLDGLQGRANGPVLQYTLQNAGYAMNAITASETYEAVERGVIKSVAGAIDFPVNMSLMELLPYWSDAGIGQYAVFGMWFSKDVYDSLPTDLQAVIDEVAVELNNGAGVEAFNQGAQSQCQQMLDAPTVEDLTAWDDSAVQAWVDDIGGASEEKWLEVATEFGIADPESYLADYKALYAQSADADYSDATIASIDQFASR